MAIKEVKAKLLANTKEGNQLDNNIYLPIDISFEKSGEGDGYYVGRTTAPNMSSFNLKDGVFNLEVVATTQGGNSITVDKNTSELDENGQQIGESCKLKVVEKVPPTVVITSPTANNVHTSIPSIEFYATDKSETLGGIKDSGIDSSTLKITLIDPSGTSLPVSKDEIDGIVENKVVSGKQYEEVYSFKYTPNKANFEDGRYTVKIQIFDNDGNSSNEAVITFVYDSSAPDLEIVRLPEVTSEKDLKIVGVTEKDVNVVITIKVISEEGETRVYTTNPDAEGNFTYTVELFEGNNTIELIATDSNGNSMVEPITSKVLLDSTVPNFKQIIIENNPTDGGQTLIIKVKVEAVYD